MSSPDLYALLVGINCYYLNRLSDGSSYPNLEGSVGDVKATRSFLQTLRKVPDDHILQLTSTLNPETGEQIDPLQSLRLLQEAADNKWILDSAQLGEILGRKSLPMENFDRGGWHFERVGKIGGRSSWRVTRSALLSLGFGILSGWKVGDG